MAVISLLLVVAAVGWPAEDPKFRADVAPLLARRCVGCHSGQKPKGGYSLETWTGLTREGKSGQPSLTLGKPDESALFARLVDSDPKRRMPPDDEPLVAAEVEMVRRWIAGGARFDGPDPAASIRSYLPSRAHPASPDRYSAPLPVFALAFSPKGDQIATGGLNEVIIWDSATGHMLRRIPGLPSRIQAIAYSPDGARLLVGGGTPGEYGEVTIVDAAAPGRRLVLGVFEDLVLAAAFAPDGKVVLAGGADRTARAFSAIDGRELWRAALHADWVTAAAVSPDGRYAATAGKDKTVKVMDAATGRLFTTYNGHRRQYGPHTGQFEVYALAFGADGTAFSAGAGAAVRAWEPAKAQEENGSANDMEARFAKAGHTRYLEFTASRPVFGLALARGNVFTAAGDGKVRGHDPKSGKLVREYAGGEEWLYAVAASDASGRVAAAGFDGAVRVWDIESGNLVVRFDAFPGLSRPSGNRP